MNSFNALDPPDHARIEVNSFVFEIPFDAYDPSHTDFGFLGIEIYYRIFVGLLPNGIDGLSFKTQLSSFGFKRLYKEEETTDDVTDHSIAMPLLNIMDYKTTPNYIKFVCTFDNNAHTLTVTYYGSNGSLLVPNQLFQLRRAVSFPDSPTYPLDKQKYFKGFDEFEDGDIDINGDPTIWTDYINASPTVNVNLVLYAYSYGVSLSAQTAGQEIDSRLTYLSYLNVTCIPYVPD